MKHKYRIVIWPEDNGSWSVEVPDLPGCFTAGSTAQEAASNAIEAIDCWLSGVPEEEVPTAKFMAESA